MRNLLAAVLVLIASTACSPLLKDVKVDAIDNSKALVVLSNDFTLDGEGGNALCTPQLGEGYKSEAVYNFGMQGMLWLISYPKGGITEINGFVCALNDKTRKKTLNPPLLLKNASGEVTYPGTIVGDWESEGFGLADIVPFGIGGLNSEDNGSLQMKRVDRSDYVKSVFKEENPELLEKFKFRVKKFEPNPNIVQ